jgi:predicted metalloprotease with PDZ domain
MRRLIAVLTLLAFIAVSAPAEAGAPLLTVRIAPGPAGPGNMVDHVDVEIAFEPEEAASGESLLVLPRIYANVDTVAETMTGFTASDADGPLPLEVRDDPDGLVAFRRWTPEREPRGEVRVRYRAPVTNALPARGAAPPYDLRTEGGGVSGAGGAFIILPDDEHDYRIALRWDLSAMGEGASAAGSFGDGDADLTAGHANRLMRAFFMAGPLHRHPAEEEAGRFSSAWLGDPPFDADALMDWTARLHAWMDGYFPDAGDDPYRVFLRINPVNAGGGAAMINSFLVTFNEATEPEGLKSTLAHEMVHTWAGSLEGENNAWFSEGVAVHHQRALPLRAGMITPEDFLEDLNRTAARYYTNALIGTPNDEIAARFWDDTRVRVLPYDRGSMYFAVLDARIRAASGGARGVDELVFETIRARRDGRPMDEAGWVALLEAELGEDGARLHRDMMAGEVMLPPSDAFGPCFERTTAPLRRFDLGFEPASLNASPRIIEGLRADSEAYRAGLREGDEVLIPVPQDSIQGDQEATLTLRVRRGEEEIDITFLPRGETVQAHQWRRTGHAGSCLTP